MKEEPDRVSLAVELFMQGFNCAQAVTAAFADLYGLSREQALRVSASFGGGIGHMREVCGAASGMFILAGLDCGSSTPGDRAGKRYNYEVVQQLAARFREQNGSIICGELLGLRPMGSQGIMPHRQDESAEPAERTQEYYRRRPCAAMVASGARIFSEYLQNKAESFPNNVKTAD